MRITGENLTIRGVEDIAINRAQVELDQGQLGMVAEACERIQRWGREGHPIYGVTTGFGELVYKSIPVKFESELQENLLRSHAAAAGDRFPDDVVRAILAARLNCLMKGYSGISVDAVRLMATFLNRQIHPVVPQQGSLGASGDLAQLSHLALPLIGAGQVSYQGQVREASTVLAETGLDRVELGYKDGLALINGTSAMTGVAALALRRAQRLLRLALWASAAFVQVMRGSTGAYQERGHVLKNHVGQMAVASAMRASLRGGKLTRTHDEVMREIAATSGLDSGEVVDSSTYLQNAYTLRCVPQILGPVYDAIQYCQRIVEEELNSCNDNPLIFDSPATIFHGGHFHGQYVAMASDFLNIAIAEIGVLAERQLNRVLDPHLNPHYPEFLASSGEAGLYCGLEGAQYLATSLASENLSLTSPASIKSIPSNGQNQDVVSMGLIAARRSLQLTDHVHTILSVLVAACYQAAMVTGLEQFSPSVSKPMRLLSERVTPYQDDAVVGVFLATIRDALRDEKFSEQLPEIN
ncbi:MAG: HAL/PAL/TAL family ammonia-lyase [Micromonosporaceae bacterium]